MTLNDENISYEETIRKIKNLEIQGAESVAIMGVKAFAEKLKETDQLDTLKKYAKILGNIRATEPALRNALSFCIKNRHQPDIIKKVLQHFHNAKEKIAEYGSNLIQDGMTIFTHCHSSSVTGIIMKAHKDGKKIKVHNTETRPRFQGRITAEELTKVGIPVDFFIDSAGRIGLQKSDLFLFGADAMTSSGQIINKIGTAYLLHFAHHFNIPAYACSNSWKFDPQTLEGYEEEIEQRDPHEIWENPPKGVTIHNPAFEPVSPDQITGIITELGIMKPEALVTEIKNAYPWMFD